MAIDGLSDNLKLGSQSINLANVSYNTKMYYGALSVYGGQFNWDSDALAFAQTASINNPTEMVALNNLTIDLKSAGLWDNIGSIWPFLGTTSDNMKYNLKDPRDLDGSGRITFGSGMSFGPNGITGDGTTNSYARTHKKNTGFFSHGVYIVDNVQEDKTDFGFGPDGVEIRLRSRNTSDQAYYAQGTGRTTASTDSSGFWVLRSYDYVFGTSANVGLYKDGSILASGSATPVDFDPSNGVAFTIGAYNSTGTTYQEGSTKTYGFAYEAGAVDLGPTGISDLNTIVQDYITLLGR